MISVLQHNGGGMVHVKDFFAEDVGKLYRSCGNCENNKHNRQVIVENSHVSKIKACAVGVNGNFGGMFVKPALIPLFVNEIFRQSGNKEQLYQGHYLQPVQR